MNHARSIITIYTACERQDTQKGEARRRRRHTDRPRLEELVQLPRRDSAGRGRKRRWWRCRWRQSS
eukprot:1275402-Prymnesium_polylepis.1